MPYEDMQEEVKEEAVGEAVEEDQEQGEEHWLQDKMSLNNQPNHRMMLK